MQASAVAEAPAKTATSYLNPALRVGAELTEYRFRVLGFRVSGCLGLRV